MITERWDDTDRGTTKVLGEKLVTVPICPPKISRGLAWYRRQASALTGRRLSA